MQRTNNHYSPYAGPQQYLTAKNFCRPQAAIGAMPPTIIKEFDTGPRPSWLINITVAKKTVLLEANVSFYQLKLFSKSELLIGVLVIHTVAQWLIGKKLCVDWK